VLDVIDLIDLLLEQPPPLHGRRPARLALLLLPPSTAPLRRFFAGAPCLQASEHLLARESGRVPLGIPGQNRHQQGDQAGDGGRVKRFGEKAGGGGRASRDSERSLRWRVLCILWDSSEVRADRSCHRGSSGPVAIEAASRVQLSRPKGARRPGGRAALHGDGGSEQRRRVIGALQAPHGDDGHAQREPDRCIDQGDAACVRRGKWKKDGKRERGRAPERASER